MKKITDIMDKETGERLFAECNRTMPRFLPALLGAFDAIDQLAADAAARGKDLPDIDAKIGRLVGTELEGLEDDLREFYKERLEHHRGAHS